MSTKEIEKDIINQFNEGMERLKANLKEQHPDINVDTVLNHTIDHQKGVSHLMGFQARVLESFKPENQTMDFNNIEQGALYAALADGRDALKTLIEQMPFEIPTNEDGSKTGFHGYVKKNIMSRLGLIEDILRGYYYDSVDKMGYYPLDAAMGLLVVNLHLEVQKPN